MEQLNVPDEMKIPVDFDDKNLPPSVKMFRPLVFRDGDSVGVVLGPDPKEGVFGCGPTAEEALKEWDDHLKIRMGDHQEDDEVARYIMDTLKASVNKI